MLIRPLASNPNALTLDAIAESLATGLTTTQELATVLPPHIVDAITPLSTTPPLPDEPVSPIPDLPTHHCTAADFTLVYLWGLPGAGKTTLVSSLLAARQDITLCNPTPATRQQRMSTLHHSHTNTPNLCAIPHDTTTHNVQATHLIVNPTHHNTKKHYPITLVEVDINETTDPWGYMMHSPNEKIHLLCIDPTTDIDRQARLLDRLLTHLTTTGILHTTVGLYVVVTKTDTMLRVPRTHRDKAAQTLITAGQQAFWQHVQGTCFDMGILDATPIAFTAGDVTLHRILRPDTTSAQQLWQRPLLLKSQPTPTTTHRILTTGNLPLTLTTFTAILTATTTAILTAISTPDPCPTDEITPPSYSQTLQNHITDTLRHITNYNDATQAFNTLDAHINLAHTTLRRDSTHVINDKEYTRCRHTLDSIYAPIINDALDNLFAQPDWNTHPDFHTLDHISLNLYQRSDCARAAVNTNRQHLKTYFEDIAPALKITTFHTLDDVKHADNIYDNYHTRYPYNNLTTLRDLSRRAHDAYTQYLDTRRPPSRYYTPFRFLFDNPEYEAYEKEHNEYLQYKISRDE